MMPNPRNKQEFAHEAYLPWCLTLQSNISCIHVRICFALDSNMDSQRLRHMLQPDFLRLNQVQGGRVEYQSRSEANWAGLNTLQYCHVGLCKAYFTSQTQSAVFMQQLISAVVFLTWIAIDADSRLPTDTSVSFLHTFQVMMTLTLTNNYSSIPVNIKYRPKIVQAIAQ